MNTAQSPRATRCTNRRRRARLNRQYTARCVDSDGKAYPVHGINLSETGARILANRSVGRGCTLELDLASGRQFRIQAQVVWWTSMGTRSSVLGLHFDPCQPVPMAELACWLHQQRAS